jgi:cell division protein ZapA
MDQPDLFPTFKTLDILEKKISLLIAKNSQLQEDKRILEERYAELEETFRRLRKGKIDPLQQDETIRTLMREKGATPPSLNAHTQSSRSMSESKSRIQVTILDESYSVRSEADPEHTLRVAGHVDSVLRSLRRSMPQLDLYRVAILGAMEITDELFRMKGSAEHERADLAMRLQRLTATVDQAMMGGAS